MADMEKDEKSQKASRVSEPQFFLQWGNRKRLRCVRVKDPEVAEKFKRRRITSRIDRFVVTPDKESSHLQANRLTRNSEGGAPNGKEQRSRKSSSPEKEDRYYSTRGSVGVDENGKVAMAGEGKLAEEKGLVWPKLYISLSSKEKEEDFLAMKGCKPPQRPKKRAKLIQRSLLLVSPGAWLTDMCQERYEVREKKSSKKRPRGLKAMGSFESDSE